jgi:parallel beta-helix repeat protein
MGLLLAVVLQTVPREAAARTWYIRADGTGDAPTIQAGVDSAAAGDVVLVAAGSYTQTSSVVIDGQPKDVVVSISKDIRLLSEGGPESTVLGSPSADVVIYFENVGSTTEVSGFRIQTLFERFICLDPLGAPTRAVQYLVGIRCQNSSPRIAGNVLSDHGIAIDLKASPALVEANTVTRSFYGIICADGSDAFITGNVLSSCGELVSSKNSALTITRNEMYDGCTAVRASSVVVTENRIHHISPCAVICGSDATIENNQFYDNPVAISLYGMTGSTVVRGNTFYNNGLGALHLSDTGAAVTIESNTIDKSLGSPAIICQRGSSPLIRNNIILRSGGGVLCVLSSSPIFACNNIFLPENQRYGGDCSDQTGLNGNIAVDPQFCGIPDGGNYYLQADSPCAPGNHPDGDDCGLIGAFGVSCGAVSTRAVTWGAIKAMYGGDRR